MRQLFFIACFAVLAAGQDFRKATWGMTQAEVLASESIKPSETHQSEGEVVVRYDSLKFGGLNGHAIYIFAKDKLVRAKYLFHMEHREENDFIADYKAIEPLLTEKYGKPGSARAFWNSDQYQEESKAYLDQDRATPESILPSDRYVGLAVSMGQLKLYTQWAGVHTKVLHGLTGENHHITHQIEYLSVELEGLEKEVRP